MRIFTHSSLLGLGLALGAIAAHAQAPDIAFDSAAGFLKLPANMHLGEAAGVATDSKGNLYVYTRTGEEATMGGSRFFTHGGSRLLQFDATGKYLREFGVGMYGLMFAQAVRVDSQDNIWAVDRGADVAVKFAPDGRFLMTLGRKPESVNPAGPAPGRGGRGGRGIPGEGLAGDYFNRPTDIAWDSAGNIFVSDAYTNARVVKLDKNGRFIKAWGSKGAEHGQFDMPNSIAVDAANNVYVADLGNKRIQVFDNDGNYKSQIEGVGSPWALCITAGSHQYLFASNSNPPDTLDTGGEIYKMELDGKILGKFGTAGKLPKEFGAVNEIDCRNPNSLYVGEVQNWRVQRLTLH